MLYVFVNKDKFQLNFDLVNHNILWFDLKILLKINTVTDIFLEDIFSKPNFF